MAEIAEVSVTIFDESVGGTPKALTSYLEALKDAFESDDRVVNYSVDYDEGDDRAVVTVKVDTGIDIEEQPFPHEVKSRAHSILDQIEEDTYRFGSWRDV